MNYLLVLGAIFDAGHEALHQSVQVSAPDSSLLSSFWKGQIAEDVAEQGLRIDNLGLDLAVRLGELVALLAEERQEVDLLQLMLQLVLGQEL